MILYCFPPGAVFCLLLGVSSDFAQPITGQVTKMTCPVISRAQPELTSSKRQKTGPDLTKAPHYFSLISPTLIVELERTPLQHDLHKNPAEDLGQQWSLTCPDCSGWWLMESRQRCHQTPRIRRRCQHNWVRSEYGHFIGARLWLRLRRSPLTLGWKYGALQRYA